MFLSGFYAVFCYGFSEKEYKLNLYCDNTQYYIYDKYNILEGNTTSQKIYLSDIYKLEKEYHSGGGGYRNPKLGRHSYDVYMYNNNIIDLRSNKLLENLKGYHSYVLMKEDNIYNNSTIIKEIINLDLEK